MATLNNKQTTRTVNKTISKLMQIKPIDLSSQSTTYEEAEDFCKKVMQIILNCQNLRFNDKNFALFQDTLKFIGCKKFDELHEQFKPDDGKTFAEWMTAKGDLRFPLSCMSSLLEKDIKLFNWTLSSFTEGGKEHSWIGKWLQTQENDEEKEM